jgi:predicted ArsR family transcriptional regulator
MNAVAKDIKQSKEDTQDAQVKRVFDLLLASKEGLTANAVGEKVGIKDTRQVRELLREAIRQAEKAGHSTKRERIPGQANKVYQIVGKGTTDSGAKAQTSSVAVPLTSEKGKQSAPISTTTTAKK